VSRLAPLRSVSLLVAATSCWGASSAVLADTKIDLAASAPVVAAGGGTTLAAIVLARGRRPWAALRTSPVVYTKLGLLEAMNLSLYIGALRLGPLPLMVALHLTSPLVLITWDVARGRRPLRMLVGAELLLIAAAIALVAVAVPGSSSPSDVLAGSALAVGSAVALAILITRVAVEAESQDPDVAAGLQLWFATALTLPLLIGAQPGSGAVGQALVAGLVLLGPGFALYWRALQTLDAPVAGVLGLNEAVVASALGGLLLGVDVSAATLGAAALILVSVGLELRGGDSRVGKRLAGP